MYACTIDFGSFSQFNKIILNFNIIVQSISNVSQTCIFCRLISASVTLFSQLLIENMEQHWTQDGSAFEEVHSIAAPIWHQTINNLLVFNIFNWLLTHIVLFSFYLIHMHWIPLIMPSRIISNALGNQICTLHFCEVDTRSFPQLWSLYRMWTLGDTRPYGAWWAARFQVFFKKQF